MLNLLLYLIRPKSGFLNRIFNVSEGGCVLHKSFFVIEKNYLCFQAPRSNNFLLKSNSRNYAKSRDIRKEKKIRVEIDENELREYFDVEKLLSDLGKPLENFKEELLKHSTLRTSPKAIESVKINFEGDTFTIQDLAEIGKKSSKLYVLDFSSFPAVIPTVISTLHKSELNLNVHQDGNKVFVPLPNVTREHREILAKTSKSYFHKCKDSVRNIQMTYKKKLDKIEKLPVETKFRLVQQLTALGDKQIKLAEEVLKTKHEELLKE